MGTWGAALYDDDSAADLRDSLKLLCKVPVPGDRLLEILKGVYGNCDPTDDEGGLFWLVVADHFERRGIECKTATATALSIIESGRDLEWAREKEADERFLKKRAAVLQELANRLRAPREFRPRRAPRKPPPLVVEAGEVYTFPTMDGRAWHPYWVPHLYPPFTPDGWGALVVLATGRAFDWLPWVGLASLTVNGKRKATLADALRARLIFHPQTMGAGRFIPKPSHARGMGLELIGRLKLDAALVKPQMSKWSVEMAIEYDWTMCYAGFNSKVKALPRGCVLSELIKK